MLIQGEPGIRNRKWHNHAVDHRRRENAWQVGVEQVGDVELYRGVALYHLERYTEAAAALERGHTVRVLNTLRFAIDLSGTEPDLQYRGKQLSDYDAILPRIESFQERVLDRMTELDPDARGMVDRATAIANRLSRGS